jgi:hypothetical protein
LVITKKASANSSIIYKFVARNLVIENIYSNSIRQDTTTQKTTPRSMVVFTALYHPPGEFTYRTAW